MLEVVAIRIFWFPLAGQDGFPQKVPLKKKSLLLNVLVPFPSLLTSSSCPQPPPQALHYPVSMQICKQILFPLPFSAF